MTNSILNFDNAVLDFIQQHLSGPFMDKAMVFITHFGDAGIFWIVIAAVLMITKKHRKKGIAMAIALILCFLIGNVIMKPVFGRMRPFDANGFTDLLISAPKDFSFPSGHTMVSFASAFVLLIMDKKLGVPAVIIAVLIAFSRLYLYVHYPTDVIAGFIIGIINAFIAVKASSYIKLKES